MLDNQELSRLSSLGRDDIRAGYGWFRFLAIGASHDESATLARGVPLTRLDFPRLSSVRSFYKVKARKMIYAFGQHELDTRVYELRRAGVVRPVEPQVFDVLAYLVQNRDRVVSKEELLEKLWPDRFVTETTLTSRVKEARKAVGDTGQKQSVIRTQRGRGYRFVASMEERGEPDPSELVIGISPEELVRVSREPAATLDKFVDLEYTGEVLTAGLAVQTILAVLTILARTTGAGLSTNSTAICYRCI